MSDDKSDFKVETDEAQGTIQARFIRTVTNIFYPGRQEPEHQQSKYQQWIAPLMILLVVLAIGGGGTAFWYFTKESPCFAIHNPILRSDATMIIQAENDAADRPDPLNVEFHGLVFVRKGTPQEKEEHQARQKWHFDLCDQNPTENMLKQGEHPVRIGFPGEPPLSEKIIIVFKNRPPIAEVETFASESAPDVRIIRGKAASELQIPGEKIAVEVLYFHEGSHQEMDVPVQMKEDEDTGIIFFEFETSVQGLPQLSPDDPGYAAPFFGFRITDQAGNSYFQEQSYAQYMAPGCGRFGFNELAMIRVEKLPENNDLHRNIIRVIPTEMPIQRQLANGTPAIELEVKSIASSRQLKWKSNVTPRKPVTLVFRDDKQLGTSFTDEYTDDEELNADTVVYAVEQEGEDGTKYRSNDAEFTKAVIIVLTVRSNVRDDIVYIDGEKYGPTPLNAELEKGMHDLKVEKNEYEPYAKEIDLQKTMTVWAKLEPVMASLQVMTEPNGATVFANGKKQGISPTEISLPAAKGEVLVRAELVGYKPREETIQFPADSKEIKLILEALPEPRQAGQLYAEVTPSDALVQIQNFNEKYRHGIELEPGTYGLIASKDGYETAEKNVVIIAGEKTEVAIELKLKTVPVAEADGNSLGMKFVYIRPGTFMMGSPSTEAGRDDDETLHKVTLSKGFYMQTTEVTQKQWKAVMGSNPSRFKDCGDDCPVEQVSWEDVQQFIRKLNGQEGKNIYRLPTEAEWEYACRAGSSTRFCFGDDENRLSEYAWYGNNSGRKTHAVGQKNANAWGLYDMHGNVWEWCQDWYGDYPSGDVTDPTGPLKTGSYRVNRGGSCFYSALYCRSAYRDRNEPGFRGDYLGFRLLRLAP